MERSDTALLSRRCASRALRSLVLICLSCIAASCGKDTASASSKPHPAGYERLKLRYQGSVGNVSYPELAADLGYLAPLELEFVGSTISGPQDIQATVTGDTDFGGAFNGAIINLIAAGAPIRAVVGVSFVDAESWNGFYVLEDSPIKGPRDFIGKKVAMNTLGAHHEFVLKEYLARGGLTKSEIEQVTLVALPPVNTEQALRQKQVDVAALGTMLRDKALARGGIRSLFSDYQLFGAFTSASYVVTERFLKQNPNTARKFVEGVAKTLEWARATPREQVIERMRAIIAKRKRNENAASVSYWRTPRSETRGGLLTDAQFQLWIDWLVRDGQLKLGQLRARQLYTNQFNPYLDLQAGERG